MNIKLIALKIFIALIALIFLLLSFSITLYVSIQEQVKLELHYMCFKLWDSTAPKKPKKPKKDKGKSKKKDQDKDKDSVSVLTKIQNMKTDIQRKVDKITGKGKKKKSDGEDVDKSDTPPKKPSFTETVTLVLDMLKIIFPQVKHLCLGVRITNLSIDMSISCEDAAKTAMVYTATASVIQNTIVYLSQLIKVKVKKVSIIPDFTTEEWQQDVFFKVKLSPFVIIASVWGIIVNSIKWILNKDKDDKNKM